MPSTNDRRCRRWCGVPERQCAECRTFLVDQSRSRDTHTKAGAIPGKSWLLDFPRGPGFSGPIGIHTARIYGDPGGSAEPRVSPEFGSDIDRIVGEEQVDGGSLDLGADVGGDVGVLITDVVAPSDVVHSDRFAVLQYLTSVGSEPDPGSLKSSTIRASEGGVTL